MALQYFLYDMTYGNTIVDRSNISFAPSPLYGEIHIDYFIPETQPLYLYANSGGTGGTIIVNSQENIDAYLGATELPPTPDGNVTYGEFTGATTALSATTAILRNTSITGATNLGSGNAIYTSVSDNKIGLKSLSAGTGIFISNTANVITICSTSSGSGITGGTNGLGVSVKNICLGGALINNTTITSGNFIYCIAGTQSSYYQNNSSVCLSMNGASAHQLRVSGCGASVESCCSKLLVYSGGTTFTSGALSDCAGIKYAADYSATYTTRSLVDKGYITGITTTLLPKSIYQTYTGTTAPTTFASKINAITGATNLGSGNGILYTSVSTNKINLKSLSGGTNVTLTCNGNYIAINASYVDTGILWTGSTSNGVGTYASSGKICSNPNMTFNGSSLSVTGNILASTYMCSPIITGSTKVCSPIVFGTTCVCGGILCATTVATAACSIGTTCVCSPIILGSTSICSPVITGSTKVCSPTIISTTSLCAAGTSKLVGATTGSTLYLTTTPPAGVITQPTLFWDATTKQIEAKTLTGGSDQYFYGESTTKTTASGTCVKAQGLSATTLAGRYQVEFIGQYGNASANACTFLALKINNVTQGTNYLGRENVAGWQYSFSLSRDVTLAAQLNCFDIWHWNIGGTACVPLSIIRVKRIC